MCNLLTNKKTKVTDEMSEHRSFFQLYIGVKHKEKHATKSAFLVLLKNKNRP